MVRIFTDADDMERCGYQLSEDAMCGYPYEELKYMDDTIYPGYVILDDLLYPVERK